MEKLHADIQELLDTKERLDRTYHDIYALFTEIVEKVKSNAYDNRVLVDLGFLFREMEKILDDARKEAKAKKDLVGRVIAMRKTKEFMETGLEDLRVVGQLASGNPDIKQVPGLPKPGSSHYLNLCDHFQIPRPVSEAALIQFRFEPLSLHLTGLAEQGVNAPEGVKTYPVYSTIFRRK